MTDKEFFEQIDFSFEITGGENEIEILPFIDLESDCSRTLIASFHVDSLEMIESARIPLKAGKNHVPFRQTVRIVKPLLWQPCGCGVPSLYSFTVAFHRKGAPFYRIEKRVGIRFVEACPEEKSFRVNGKEIKLVSCDPDFSLPEKNRNDRFSGNLVHLNDTDPELEEKLEFCGRTGLIAVLEMTGKMNPGVVDGLFGLCIFTAESGNGKKWSARNGRTGLNPFLTHDELNLLLHNH